MATVSGVEQLRGIMSGVKGREEMRGPGCGRAVRSTKGFGGTIMRRAWRAPGGLWKSSSISQPGF